MTSVEIASFIVGFHVATRTDQFKSKPPAEATGLPPPRFPNTSLVIARVLQEEQHLLSRDAGGSYDGAPLINVCFEKFGELGRAGVCLDIGSDGQQSLAHFR